MASGTASALIRDARSARAAPVAAVAAMAIMLALSTSARAESSIVRVGRAPMLPAGTSPVAAVASERPMRITLALEPHNPSALAAYAAAVSNPASPDYRRFLKVGQFARRFGARPMRVAALERSLREHGLIRQRLSANGLSISVSAPTGAIERAFSVALEAVRLPDGRPAVLSSQAPALDGSVAGSVQAVIGLTSFDHLDTGFAPRGSARQVPTGRIRPALASPHLGTGGPHPCRTAAAAGPAQSAYTADQIASAYDFSPLYRAGDEGAGVTIAVFELEPVQTRDLSSYQSCYGTDTQITYVPVDGGVRPGPGSGESALDIEQLIGLAPRARLLIYQAPNSNSNSPGSGPYDEFSAIISQDAASVISNSWGQCEPMEGQADASAENVLFEEAATQGQTFLSSAGDSGSEDCDYGKPNGNTSLQVDDPASQPFVTGVGGTSLSALGPPPAETVWNNGGQVAGLVGLPGAGGGGISSFWPMPPYQSGAPATLGVLGTLSSAGPCHATGGSCREVPDVSAAADPQFGYLIYYNGVGARSAAPSGWQGTGGTSAATPLWAAVIALADANPACGHRSIGFANPALYRFAGQGQATYFHDVTSGNNDLTGTSGGIYPAGPGYDMATGLGSPDAGALAAALCEASLRLGAPRSELTFLRSADRARIRVSAPAGIAAAYRVRGLPRGLVLDPDTGVISGAPLSPGRRRVAVRATDAAGDVRVATFRWTVDERPRVSGARLKTGIGGVPTLSLTIAAGRFAPPLRWIELRPPPGLRVGRAFASLIAQGADGRPLPTSARVSHGTLVIGLRDPSLHVRLVLGPGALAGRVGDSPMVAGRPSREMTVTVVTVRPKGQRRGQAATVVTPVGTAS